MQKVLLIGSHGLVGKTFIRLYHSSYQIIGIDKEDRLEDVDALSDFDIVIFLAQSEDYKSTLFTTSLMSVNVSLLHQTLLACKNSQTKFIHFSTGSVYKNDGHTLELNSPLDEQSQNPYVLSKLMGEKLLQSFITAFAGIHIVRPFFIYGPGQNPQMLFNVMINKIKQQEEISLSGDEGLIFNPIFSEDAASMIHQLIQHGSNSGLHYYNLAGKETSSLKDMLIHAGKLLQLQPKIVIKGNQNSRLVAAIDENFFKPKFDLITGLNKTIEDEQG